jgi:hypothetical protein
VILIGYYAVLIPMLNIVLLVATIIPYSIFSLWAGISGYNVTKTDPADPVLYASDKYQKKVSGRADADSILETMPLPPVHNMCYNDNDRCNPCSVSLPFIYECICISCTPRSNVDNGVVCDQGAIAEQHRVEGNEFCYYCQVFTKKKYVVFGPD